MAVECEFCENVSSCNMDLKRHIASVHEDKKKDFKCDICDKSFSQEAIMNIHMKSVHGGLKAFKCKICEKGFSLKTDMNRHISSVHEGKKPFICMICDKGFL